MSRLCNHMKRQVCAEQVFVLKGFLITILCKMMGYRSVQITQIYVKITN